MRLLVVEDDQLLNNTLCYNLAAAGYIMDTATTKAAATAFYEAQNYDLIVLDVNLPDGNGFDLCKEIKERRPDTAVIFLTANDMENDMLKGFELGADDYVTKPFPISVFLKKVSALLNSNAAYRHYGNGRNGAMRLLCSQISQGNPRGKRYFHNLICLM